MIYIIALLVGIAAILAVAYPLFRRTDRSDDAEADEGSADLRMRREKLYDAIRELDLERDSGSLSQEEHEKIRTTYEMQAASLLQEEERRGKPRLEPSRKPAPAKAAATTPPALSQRLGLIIPAALILVVGVGIGYFLATSLNPREERMSITGNVPRAGGEAKVPSSLEEANEAFNRGDFRQALDGYKKVLDKDPQNVEALTQIGVLLAQGQHFDEAIMAFDRVLTIQPNHPKALFEKGLVLFQGKVQPREGVKVWEHLIKTAPPDNEYALTAKRLLDQVRSSMGRPPTESPAKPSTR